MKQLALFFTLTLILVGTLSVKLDPMRVNATETAIYIRADGSIDPPSAPIHRDGDVYTLIGNVTYQDEAQTRGIVIERNNVILDGNKCIVSGLPGPPAEIRGVGISLVDVDNVTIRNMTVHAFGLGAYVARSSNIGVNKNLLLGVCGITIESVVNSSFCENSLGGHVQEGVHNFPSIIMSDSIYNTISRNNLGGFLGMTNCSFNNISLNQVLGIPIEYEEHSIVVSQSFNNRIYHNNFGRVACDSSPNIWDDGYPSGGNYWSDYVGVDLFSGSFQNESGSDGFGDTPRLVSPNNRDNYPCVNPYYDFDTAVTAIKSPKTAVGRGRIATVNVTTIELGTLTIDLNLNLEASFARFPRQLSATLQGNYPSGWNNTIPGPTITATKGDTIELTLQVSDMVHHLFYVDYNNNSFPDPAEPQTPPFINATSTLSFTMTSAGNFTYYCAYYQNTMLGTIAVNPDPLETMQIGSENVTLESKQEKIVSFFWNTTGLAYGNYTLKAYTKPVQNEVNLTNNNFTGGWVVVSLVGDISGADGWPDGTVDMRDVGLVARYFGEDVPPSDPNWDIYEDWRINMQDIGIVARHFGERCF